MGLRAFLVAVGVGFSALTPVVALSETGGVAVIASDIAALSKTMKIGDVMGVMRAEGLKHSGALSKDLLAGQSEAAWQAVVTLIYSPDKMTARFDAALQTALAGDPAVVADSAAFFGTDLGQRVLGLEIDARIALLDEAAEAAAQKGWRDLATGNPARAEQINQFAKINDLIESNVMGSLNANLAFYRGLSQAGAFGDAMPEDQMLTEVWAQEPSIRNDTTEWLYPFLMLSYQPISDADMQAYVDFSATPSGKALNAAVFAAFDAVMVATSYDLGAAAGRLMVGQDI